jgi:hypothetical protein
MATASTSSRLYVRGAAVAAAGVAFTTDVGLDERPTHSVVLGLVAVVVWAIHRRLSRHALALTTLPAVSAALATQPVLHLASKVDHPPTGAHGQVSGALSDLAIDAPVAGMQVVVPVVALIASALVAHLLYLLLEAVRCPLGEMRAVSEAPDRVRGLATARRLGSMLHWCGWVIRAARRGPPSRGHVFV